MKAVNIYPSSPISLAKGSKKFATKVRSVEPAKVIFAKSHITIPVGAATATALPQNKQSSIKNRTHKHLTNLRLAVWWELKHKRRRLTFK